MIYMAPEIISGSKYGPKADVYAFGIFLYEILTNKIPYPEYQSGKMAEFIFTNKVVNENYRPKFTVKIKESLKALIEQCWSADPKDRPTFIELYNKLAFNEDDMDGSISSIDGKYYLDGVDVDAILSYIDEISATFQYTIPPEMKEKLKIIEKEQEKLKSVNTKLILENQQLKKRTSMITTHNPSFSLPIGTFFYSARTENEIEGAVKCNGQTYYSSRYPNFVNHFLKTKKVETVLISQWNKIKKTGDVGCFGYDGGNVFIVPLISSGTFLSNADVGSIDGKSMKQGHFKYDQITNITGSSSFSLISLDHNNVKKSEGSLTNNCTRNGNSTVKYGGGDDDWIKNQVINFDASKSVRTGDRVMPRTVFQNLYIFIGS